MNSDHDKVYLYFKAWTLQIEQNALKHKEQANICQSSFKCMYKVCMLYFFIQNTDI